MKKNKYYIIALLSLINTICLGQKNQQIIFSQSDRDAITKLQIQLDEFEKRVNIQFEALKTQYNITEEKNNNRFEYLEKQIDDLKTFLYWGFGILFSFMAFILGFIFWDRRTMLKPLEAQFKTLEVSVDDLDKNKVQKLILSLRELSKVDIKLAGVLRQFNIL